MKKILLVQRTAALLSASLVAFSASRSAHAQLLLYEGFDYTAGEGWATTGSGYNGGTGWGGIAWSATAAAVATNYARSLSYANGATLVTSGGSVVLGYTGGYPTAGGQTAIIQRVLPNTLTNYFGGSGGTLWISFLYQNWTDNPGGFSDYRQANFGLFLGATTNASGVSGVNGNERVDVGSPNTYQAPGDYLSLWGQNVPQTAAAQSTLATPRGSGLDAVFVVLRLDFNNTTVADTVYAWFNPVIGWADPSIATAISTTVSDFSGANAIRFQAGNLNASGTNSVFAIDELRVGYTAGDIGFFVPEPSTIALFTLGSLVLPALSQGRKAFRKSSAS